VWNVQIIQTKTSYDETTVSIFITGSFAANVFKGGEEGQFQK
jgi:hypothetical protein